MFPELAQLAPRTIVLANDGVAKRLTLSTSAEQSSDQRYDEQHEEYEKQHFRDFRGTGGDASESEYGCDQCDDKKYQRIVEHL